MTTRRRRGSQGNTFDDDPQAHAARSLRDLGVWGESLTRHVAKLRGQQSHDLDVDADAEPPRHYPAEYADREERAAGRKLKSAFWVITGERPDLAPGDRVGAAMFLDRIRVALERGKWTRNEWARLYELERIWRARAEGRDPRFEVAGTRPGRLSRATEQQIRIARAKMREITRAGR